MEVSDKLMAPSWQAVPDFSLAKAPDYEGPECFMLQAAANGNPPIWCLILDSLSLGTGYQPFVTNDLAGGKFTPETDFSFPFPFRHGSVMAVTDTEYQALKATYPNTFMGTLIRRISDFL
jgi:hypothetical protein